MGSLTKPTLITAFVILIYYNPKVTGSLVKQTKMKKPSIQRNVFLNLLSKYVSFISKKRTKKEDFSLQKKISVRQIGNSVWDTGPLFGLCCKFCFH